MTAALMVGDRVEVVEFSRLPNGDKTEKSLEGWLVCMDDQSVTIADSPDWASRDDAWEATFSLSHSIVSKVVTPEMPKDEDENHCLLRVIDGQPCAVHFDCGHYADGTVTSVLTGQVVPS